MIYTENWSVVRRMLPMTHSLCLFCSVVLNRCPICLSFGHRLSFLMGEQSACQMTKLWILRFHSIYGENITKRTLLYHCKFTIYLSCQSSAMAILCNISHLTLMLLIHFHLYKFGVQVGNMSIRKLLSN